jgi:hypothetical protein
MEIKQEQVEKKQTYGEWWEENQHLNIFKIPEENIISETVGLHTINIPTGRDEVVVREVMVHEDLNYTVLSEKVVKTGKRAKKKGKEIKEKEEATVEPTTVASKNIELKK